ncbi:hypothetical protein HDA32_004238 [Spinactinospora alkalitolerans]|uniref:Uncharacterized protein n=1 Tax=Spinactinospora alkalitolerans TaxID=687207 RepID=A0A852TYW1_9ACTN|nr:hypothetical protein [Spinactinospora alkalitolerans]NYE49118.1 hypothetical protein [Spinactinospora alkalitolerans]
MIIFVAIGLAGIAMPVRARHVGRTIGAVEDVAVVDTGLQRAVSLALDSRMTVTRIWPG